MADIHKTKQTPANLLTPPPVMPSVYAKQDIVDNWLESVAYWAEHGYLKPEDDAPAYQSQESVATQSEPPAYDDSNEQTVQQDQLRFQERVGTLPRAYQAHPAWKGYKQPDVPVEIESFPSGSSSDAPLIRGVYQPHQDHTAQWQQAAAKAQGQFAKMTAPPTYDAVSKDFSYPETRKQYAAELISNYQDRCEKTRQIEAQTARQQVAIHRTYIEESDPRSYYDYRSSGNIFTYWLVADSAGNCAGECCACGVDCCCSVCSPGTCGSAAKECDIRGLVIGFVVVVALAIALALSFIAYKFWQKATDQKDRGRSGMRQDYIDGIEKRWAMALSGVVAGVLATVKVATWLYFLGHGAGIAAGFSILTALVVTPLAALIGYGLASLFQKSRDKMLLPRRQRIVTERITLQINGTYNDDPVAKVEMPQSLQKYAPNDVANGQGNVVQMSDYRNNMPENGQIGASTDLPPLYQSKANTLGV